MLGSDDVEGYLRAVEPRTFSFPADHGPHPGFRNEWWYLTGNLETPSGRRFGYQVTFFANAVRPETGNACDASAWCANHIWMGHAAISDFATGEHHAAEVFARQAPGLAGAASEPFRVWVQDWQLYSRNDGFPWTLEVLSDDFALVLLLAPKKSPVLQGDRGLSKKNADPGNASYYYSITRIGTTGRLVVDGQSLPVSGDSWLDREWSTSALAPDQSGWDWFALQFDDGTELMYYQLRDDLGNAHPNSSGNLTSLMGLQVPITPERMVLEERIQWLSNSGISYTTEWRMQYVGSDWIIRALFDDQLMDLTFQYWEGAVEVLDSASGEIVGRGYLEMVR